MTENKRFTYTEQFNGFCDVYDNGKILSCMRLEYVENTINMLNALNDKCEFLEIENEILFDELEQVKAVINKKWGDICLHEENKTFRKALKELKTIGDYQAIRIKELDGINSLIEDEIDKKIAVLTDAKIKSFQNGDKELFGKIKFSIQVLRELKEVILE